MMLIKSTWRGHIGGGVEEKPVSASEHLPGTVVMGASHRVLRHLGPLLLITRIQVAGAGLVAGGSAAVTIGRRVLAGEARG